MLECVLEITEYVDSGPGSGDGLLKIHDDHDNGT